LFSEPKSSAEKPSTSHQNQDYRKTCRKDLGPNELEKARKRRDYYFYHEQKERRFTSHRWFKDVEAIFGELGWSYFDGTAIHFDLEV
jgi:hypothetical protein